jgi:hypothetical protein
MRTTTRRVVALLAVGAAALSSCGSDDTAGAPEDSAADVGAEGVDDADDAESNADDASADVGRSDDQLSDGDDESADDGAADGDYNSGSAVVVFDDATYEFAPTGDPYSCFIVEESGIVMATFDGVSDAGDILYLDYDSDFGDEVSANISTVDPVETWYFGTSIGGADAPPTEFTVGDGEITVSGEMSSNVSGIEPRAATVTVRCD